ncbi:MAG: imelysin family protein [Flavobacteriaceae bacterium]|nr:imelysin family protein [Flavobacteriaceae bacterium]
MKKLIYITLFFSLLLLFSGCNNKKLNLFKDYKEILQNWSENIIVPSYKNYQTEVSVLVTDAKNFKENRTEENFENLKKSWLNAYKAFQKILIFNFATAEKVFLIEMANTYPTNPENINKNIQLIANNKSNEINLKPTHADIQRTYQGFPALDYLLFEESHTLEYYQSPKGDDACAYIVLLTNFLKENIDYVVNNWETYINGYIENTDISSNGTYSMTINSFIKAYEKNIRAEKVGYAAGAINAQGGKASPEIIEAYYNGKVSKELLSTALHSSQDFFNGKYFNGDKKGRSLYSSLMELNQKDLANKINNQYDTIYKVIENMPNSLKETAISDNKKMRELYTAMQKNVAYYKTHMIAVLSVTLGYVDSDGD